MTDSTSLPHVLFIDLILFWVLVTADVTNLLDPSTIILNLSCVLVELLGVISVTLSYTFIIRIGNYKYITVKIYGNGRHKEENR